MIGKDLIELEKARSPGGVVTQATFDAFTHMCDVAKLFINMAVEQQQAKGTRSFSYTRYTEALRDARDTLKDIVKYQRPTFQAVMWGDVGAMAAMGLGPAQPGDGAKVIDLPTDHVAAARIYQRLIAVPQTKSRAAG